MWNGQQILLYNNLILFLPSFLLYSSVFAMQFIIFYLTNLTTLQNICIYIEMKLPLMSEDV